MMAESSGKSNLDNYDQNNLNNLSKVCKVCDIELNSSEQFQQHQQGQKHLSKTKFDRRLRLLPKDENSSNNSNLMPQSLIFSYRSGASNDGGEVSVDESPLYGDSKRCNVCDVNFTSEVTKDDHYTGKKHAVAIKKMKMKHLQLNCDDCKMQFTSEISAKDHFDSLKHKKKIAFGSNSSLQSLGSNDTDNTQWVSCNVCNVELNSKRQLDIHCLSLKHKKKLEVQRPLSDKNETRDFSLPTLTVLKELPNSISTPKAEKKETVARRLVPSNILVKSANEIPKDLNKNMNSFGNSCDNSKSSLNTSGVSALESGDSDGSRSETQSRNPSSSPERGPLYNSSQETTTPKMISIASDSSMKKVLNSAQNNNVTDVPSRSHSSPIITNNLTMPEETPTQPRNNSGYSNSQPNISNEQITDIVKGLRNISINSQVTETKRLVDRLGNESNVTNDKMHRQSSPTGHGSRQPRTSTSRSPDTEDNEIPQSQKDYIVKAEMHGIVLGYICLLCNSKVCQGAVKSHIEGMNHKQKMMTLQVPENRDLPPVKQDCEDATTEAFQQTRFCPRSYQVELFEKCYSNDSIIFLPTGTGKTLCASMLIAYMLKQNPRRSVLFLVDKVLLVFQQKRFIEGQLKKKFKRFDFEDDQKLVEREVSIACVCGGTVKTDDRPLWKHDIIISTAAYCSNMMNQKVLRWKDFCFVVVDEAHHCVKNHPFRKIFTTEHSTLDKHERPKILGLTASPAGEETIEGTIRMLVCLSNDMGNAKIAIVEDTVEQLKKFKSNAKLEIEMFPPSNEEMAFNSYLQNYLGQCLLHLKEKSNICDYFDFKTVEDDNLLTAERLDDLQSALNELTINSDKVATTSLLFHMKKITTALSVSLEMGIPLALEELRSLTDKTNKIDSFSQTLELGLTPKALDLGRHIKEMCEKYSKVMDDAMWEQDEIMSTVHFLIHKITDLLDQENKNATVLVLVKQRQTAMRLNTIMQRSSTMKQRGLSCVSLVGHGAGSSTGMNVNDQKKTLDEISRNLHQVIIATSVAEEGIDLPECSLVITMKPPSSITTLVQMRGRARKKHSLFLTICGNEKQKTKLENLLKDEQTMEEATRRLVNYYKEV